MSDPKQKRISKHHNINIPVRQVEIFCRKWRVTQLALFGSVLRVGFQPDSDVDVLISFQGDVPWSLLDMVTMQEELQEIFDRDVDLVEREGLLNPFRRRAILENLELLYDAAQS